MAAVRDGGRDRDRGRDDARGGGRERSSSGGRAGFSYRGRSTEEVTRRAKQSSGRYDSIITEEVTWYKPHDGENQIRIMPWLDGADPEFDALVEKWGSHWGIDIIVHRNVGPDNGTYLCLDKMKGEPCPPCDAYRDGEDDLRGSDRVLCWLIDRKNEKAGPQLWGMPLGTSKDISAVSQVKGSGAVLLVDDPEEGYDVYFDREGEKKRTTYKRVEVARDPSPLHENEKKQNDWLAYISEHRLPDLLKFFDPEYLDKVLSGQNSKREDGDADGTERGSSRRRRDDGDGDADGDSDRGRSSRRGRGAEDANAGGSRGRRGSSNDPEDDADGEFTRSSRRGREAEPEGDPDDAPEGRGGGRAERASGRSSRRGGGDDASDEVRSSRRGRDRDEPADDPDERRGGGRTERYRGGGDKDADPEADGDGEGDQQEARDRLSRMGRRGRK